MLISLQTGGYPTLAVREFLHKLWLSLCTSGCQFLYFGDHDLQGGQIYTKIKYGARASAWASDRMVVPDLQHMTPTKDQVMKMTEESFTPLYIGESIEASLEAHLQRRNVNGVDRSLNAGMQALGLYEDEPELQAMVNAVLKKGWVSIASLPADL